METLFIGQNTIFLPEVDSTNSYAIELLKNVNPVEGTAIYSTHQTHGRGQRGNNWLGEPGLNLAASFILKPHFLTANKLFYIYIISALAVHDLMAELLNSSQFDIKIKWPNDILIGSKKIAGILNENMISQGLVSNCVVGIGLNLNQINFKAMENTTSLAILTNKTTDIKSTLNTLCKYFEYYYLKLRNNHFEELLQNYYSHFYKLGEFQNFLIKDQIISLKVKGISKDGLLNLSNAKNEDSFYDIKEIKWV